MLEMAPGVYGFNEGVLHYFGRPLSELVPYEIHILQYIIPRPLFVPKLFIQTHSNFAQNLKYSLSIDGMNM